MLEKKKYKCVVFDLDNTIWNGTLLEKDELQLKDGLKETLEILDQKGILMSISSKNDTETAEEKLKEFGINHYFLYPQINWDPKSISLKKIQKALNIGFDSIAFIDDQAYEREEVKFAESKIDCYDIDILENLSGNEMFTPRFITVESKNRRKMYLDDQMRTEEEQSYKKVDTAFLKTQKMEFFVNEASEENLQRIEELVHRSNQLNATGKIYSYTELKNAIKSPNYKVYISELKDKFGSYGKIGVCLIDVRKEEWVIELFLMSCRVMSRGVGNVLLNKVIELAIKDEKKLYCEFKSTGKNKLMYMTLKFAGFEEEEGTGRLFFKSKKVPVIPEYVKLTFK